MVSMTKTQLTIRQNVKKNKIKKFHFFLSWEKNEISEKDVKKKPPGSSPENNFRHQNNKFHNICNYWFYWCFVQKVLLTGFI